MKLSGILPVFALLLTALTAGIPAYAQQQTTAQPATVQPNTLKIIDEPEPTRPPAPDAKGDDTTVATPANPQPGAQLAPKKVEEPTLQDQLTQKLQTVKEHHFLTFNSENDMYGGGTDQNYTNGARITYFDLGAQPPAFFNAVDKLVPTFSINKTTSIYYTLGHNLYTPKDITRVTQDPNDRPWAAFLYTSAGLMSVTKNHIDEVEATLGVIGPAALGRQVQTFVHENISDSPTPRGWGNQLSNEPGLMLSWQRRWPERYGFDAMGLSTGVEPHFGVTLGNIYTYANAGLSLRLSPYEGRWQDDPIRVRPAMPGTGAFIVPEDKFAWHLFGGIEGRAIARNIFLDGNTFEDSYSVDKRPLVMDLNAGVAFTYSKYRLSYAIVYRTKEFDTQDDPSVFGTVSLGIRY
ncbi:MAG: lipid A deacylase LpxR family protein [Micavibrio sp.]|nr:lipid A deacylase LpxR family protein [Micavibrio sp.]